MHGKVATRFLAQNTEFTLDTGFEFWAHERVLSVDIGRMGLGLGFMNGFWFVRLCTVFIVQ